MKRAQNKALNDIAKSVNKTLNSKTTRAPTSSPITPTNAYAQSALYFTIGCVVGCAAVYTYMQSTYDRPLLIIPSHPTAGNNTPPLQQPPTFTSPPPIPSSDLPVFVQRLLQYSLPLQPIATSVNSSDAEQLHGVLIRDGYVVKYNTRTHNADWVGELITGDSTTPPSARQASGYNSEADDDGSVINDGSIGKGEVVSRDKSEFHISDDVAPLFQATLAQYNRSGYDRGHLVPAADMRTSQQAMNDTFHLTNISPQAPAFNRGYNSLLEAYIRTIARKSIVDHVVVYTGPLFVPQREATGPNGAMYACTHNVIGGATGLHVPTHFFKVVLVALAGSNKYITGSFILPNNNIPVTKPLVDFSVPLEQVELYSGYVFFDKLHNERIAQYFTIKDMTQLPKLHSNDGGITARLLHNTGSSSIHSLCDQQSCMYWNEFAPARIQMYHKQVRPAPP